MKDEYWGLFFCYGAMKAVIVLRKFIAAQSSTSSAKGKANEEGVPSTANQRLPVRRGEKINRQINECLSSWRPGQCGGDCCPVLDSRVHSVSV